MESPRVSIVVPAHNRAAFIERSVRSALAQTFSDLEVIVVDDASTDETVQRVEQIRDPRLVVLRHETNRGAQAARNTGLARARGEFVAFLDSDDELCVDKVALQVEAFSRAGPEVGVIFGRYLHQLREGRRIMVAKLGDDAYRSLLTRPSVHIITLLVRRSCFEAIGPHDEGVRAHQEWDLALRLAQRFQFREVPRVVGTYYDHPSPTISKDLSGNVRGYQQVFEKHRGEIERVLGRKGVARHFLRMAFLWMEAGRADEARRWYLRALAMDPTRVRAWLWAPIAAAGPGVHRGVVALRERLRGI